MSRNATHASVRFPEGSMEMPGNREGAARLKGEKKSGSFPTWPKRGYISYRPAFEFILAY